MEKGTAQRSLVYPIRAYLIWPSPLFSGVSWVPVPAPMPGIAVYCGAGGAGTLFLVAGHPGAFAPVRLVVIAGHARLGTAGRGGAIARVTVIIVGAAGMGVAEHGEQPGKS